MTHITDIERSRHARRRFPSELIARREQIAFEAIVRDHLPKDVQVIARNEVREQAVRFIADILVTGEKTLEERRDPYTVTRPAVYGPADWFQGAKAALYAYLPGLGRWLARRFPVHQRIIAPAVHETVMQHITVRRLVVDPLTPIPESAREFSRAEPPQWPILYQPKE